MAWQFFIISAGDRASELFLLKLTLSEKKWAADSHSTLLVAGIRKQTFQNYSPVASRDRTDHVVASHAHRRVHRANRQALTPLTLVHVVLEKLATTSIVAVVTWNISNSASLGSVTTLCFLLGHS
jgi:hypothetical protein